MTLRKTDILALRQAAEVADAQRELVKVARAGGFARRSWSGVATIFGTFVTVVVLLLIAGDAGRSHLQPSNQVTATYDPIMSAPVSSGPRNIN
jgi:hypothetical protein